MMTSDVPKLVAIGKKAYVFQPEAALSSGTRSDPSLILIFGGMGAELSHFHTFVQNDAKLFPGATVLVILNTLEFFLSTQRTREANLEPVAHRILVLFFFQTVRVDFMVVFFLIIRSIGGAWQLSTLSTLLHEKSFSSPKFPSAIIIDSSPGGTRTLSNVLAAVTPDHRSWPIRFLISSLVALVYFAVRLFLVLFRRPHPIEAVLAQLLKPDVMSWTTKDTPRLYVFSQTDALVPVADVKTHINMARDAKLNVTLEEYGDSRHVRHHLAEPQRYWAAVQKLWNSAIPKL
ncbi:hypothetical protein C8J56DRAFT_1057404 [Mycena floridula]|nr:hypothetical protein C8J56DRAFT_1057404 [Mycena floridula]